MDNPVKKCRLTPVSDPSFPVSARERMSDITALRLARVKTSTIRSKRSKPLGKTDEAFLLHLLADALH